MPIHPQRWHGVEMRESDRARLENVAIGAIVRTGLGNEFRRFSDGWSPRNGAHWDRWTVYTSDELRKNFNIVEFVVIPSLGSDDV